MLRLWGVSDFRRLWLGQFASSLGTWLLVVAVPLYVFDLTRSTAATGATFVAETLPALALGPAAGVIVDRLDRRQVMMAADVVRAGAVLSMLAADSPSRLWVIYAALLVENSAAQVFRPARQALIPALLDRRDRVASANAMFAMIDGLVRLVGSVLGGLLYTALGFEVMVVANAASFLVSAAGCYVIRYRAPRRQRAPRVTLADGAAELRVGLRHVWRERFLRGLLVVTAVFYLANGALTALLVPFARTELSVDPDRYGFLLAALGIGYLAGTPLARIVIERFSTRSAVVLAIPWLAFCFALAFAPRVYSLTLVGFALAGAPAVVLLVAVQTAYQRRTPDLMIGRVAAAFLTVEMTVSVLGATASSSFAQVAGLMPAITVSLLVLAGLAAVIPMLLPRRLAVAGM